MSHNKKIITPGGTVFLTLVLTPAVLRELDETASESIDGDNGGTWNPTSPIIIGGAGVNLPSLGVFGGGLTTGSNAPAGSLILGDSDYPTFSVARTRNVLFHIGDVLGEHLDANLLTTMGMYDQSVPGSFRYNGTSTHNDIYLPFDITKFPPGATISSVTARFRVGARPSSVPGTLPLISFGSIAGVDTASLAAPGTVDVYYNNGLPQNLQVVPATNSVAIAGRPYYLNIEDMANTGNIYHSVIVEFTNILDMRPGL